MKGKYEFLGWGHDRWVYLTDKYKYCKNRHCKSYVQNLITGEVCVRHITWEHKDAFKRYCKTPEDMDIFFDLFTGFKSMIDSKLEDAIFFKDQLKFELI